MDPLKGAAEGGVSGFFGGVVSGATGLLVKPALGVVGLAKGALKEGQAVSQGVGKVAGNVADWTIDGIEGTVDKTGLLRESKQDEAAPAQPSAPLHSLWCSGRDASVGVRCSDNWREECCWEAIGVDGAPVPLAALLPGKQVYLATSGGTEVRRWTAVRGIGLVTVERGGGSLFQVQFGFHGGQDGCVSLSLAADRRGHERYLVVQEDFTCAIEDCNSERGSTLGPARFSFLARLAGGVEEGKFRLICQAHEEHYLRHFSKEQARAPRVSFQEPLPEKEQEQEQEPAVPEPARRGVIRGSQSDLQARFLAATEWVVDPLNKMPAGSDEILTLYKHFKQVKSGDVTGNRPWAYQLEARAKWDAWATVKGLVNEQAMQRYIDALALQAEKYGKPFQLQ